MKTSINQFPTANVSYTQEIKKRHHLPKYWLLFLLFAFITLSITACSGSPALAAPGVTLTINPNSPQPQQVSSGVQLLVLLTVLSIAPSILILATSFTRIMIVLSMVRSAIGMPTIPPNQVLIGLSLLLTFFIMAPVYNKIDQQALQPYLSGQMNQDTAFQKAMDPIREFMFKQTREKDIELFLQINNQPKPQTLADISTVVLFPSFVISELRTAFTMGFLIYIPFLIIDMVVSSVLLSMGMMMLPPTMVSLPFKLLLFVLVDGWFLIVRSLTMSFS
jgi:flagellar biosynthesis protein FliP